MITQNIPKKADERRAWIKYQLELVGYNFASLAREFDLSRTCVLSALYRSYPKMEGIIAGKLGLRPEDLWPERYSFREQSNRRGRKRQ